MHNTSYLFFALLIILTIVILLLQPLHAAGHITDITWTINDNGNAIFIVTTSCAGYVTIAVDEVKTPISSIHDVIDKKIYSRHYTSGKQSKKHTIIVSNLTAGKTYYYVPFLYMPNSGYQYCTPMDFYVQYGLSFSGSRLPQFTQFDLYYTAAGRVPVFHLESDMPTKASCYIFTEKPDMLNNLNVIQQQATAVITAKDYATVHDLKLTKLSDKTLYYIIPVIETTGKQNTFYSPFCIPVKSSTTPTGGKRVRWQSSYTLTVSGNRKNSELHFWMVDMRATNEMQHSVQLESVSPQPFRISNKKLYFYFDSPQKNIVITTTWSADIYPFMNTLSAQEKSYSPQQQAAVNRQQPWLTAAIPGRIYPENKTIQTYAHSLFTSSIVYSNIFHTYRWIIDRLEYDYAAGKNLRTASDTISSGRAECSGYSAVFAALLRAQQQPVKIAFGVMLPSAESPRSELNTHVWNEVFSRDEKWLPVDVTHGEPEIINYRCARYFPADRITFGYMRGPEQLTRMENGSTPKILPIDNFTLYYRYSSGAIAVSISEKHTLLDIEDIH